ncbi:hypothetical protein CRM22_011376 [Opisthorchis felineus]|uniref:Chloride channel CLIC-like protein 1 n=1 Tax=Opisthorchis felineus TaxID=147828 RepID=A0A4S2JPZ4_OPIFE|nr:hypothetical protein CRM22_011376 [Opisthorchis felineus]
MLSSAMLVTLGLIICTVLMDSCAAQRDPFDMFAEVDHPLQELSSDFMTSSPPARTDQEITTMEHYKELHRILVRILWNSLRISDLSALQEQVVKLQIHAILDEKDMALLAQYCSLNQTVSRTVSADTINSIFSRLFTSVAVASDIERDFWWLSPSSFLYSAIFSLATLILMLFVFHIGLRRLWLSVPCLIIAAVVVQSLVKKYHERLAEKMSVLSRYDGPPEHCKPRHLQSWSVWLSGLFSLRPGHDECAHYYQHIVTEPWISASLEETIWELVMGPIVTFGRVSGKSVGLFYDNVVNYVPFWVAVLLIPLCLIVSVIPFLCFVRFLLLTPKVPVSRRRPKHKQIKSQSLPSITKN